MKTLISNPFVVSLAFLLFIACAKDNPDPGSLISEKISPVEDVTIRVTGAKGIEISWKNPEDNFLDKIELTVEQKNENGTMKTLLVDAEAGKLSKETIELNTKTSYLFTITAINKAGVRSEEVKKSFISKPVSPWVFRADTLMKALVRLYLDGKPRDIWSSNYPQSDGYWDGAAVIWGHGAAFSGYTAFKKASYAVSSLKEEIEQKYDNRLLTGIDKFRNKRGGGPEAYAVYPGEGDERFYDDNLWVGLDMAHLYLLTKEIKYLDRAKLVWQFVLSGSDDVMGGGVYWKEGEKSKHSCSTFPAAVLGLTLYEATNDDQYLEQAKLWYNWGIEVFQDKSDFLIWDNVRLTNPSDLNSKLVVDKAKYSYNSGQALQAASMLYRITKNPKFLTGAQQIAKAAYNRWFVSFRSYFLNESFNILEPGHVWFQAIMMRGFLELHKVDNNREYVDAYEKTLQHAWLSPARNRGSNLINQNFKGTTSQSSWELIHQGAILEMIANLALLDMEGR